MSENHSFSTMAVHAGQQADPTTGACATPIYQTASYEFKSAEQAAKLFNLQEFGNIYSRLTNPGGVVTDIGPIAQVAHEAGQIAAGAGPDVVRLSVGIEDIKDILADLDQALTA